MNDKNIEFDAKFTFIFLNVLYVLILSVIIIVSVYCKVSMFFTISGVLIVALGMFRLWKSYNDLKLEFKKIEEDCYE